MKERIVKYKHKKEDCKKCRYEGICSSPLCETEKVEQVPETWEDLKELVIDRAKYIFNDKFFGDGEYFVVSCNYFIQDGRILDAYQNCFAANRTPQQMWQIIKALVEE